MKIRRLFSAMLFSAATAGASPPPRLLVLGVPHFANPGRDLVDAKVENVLAPTRQREIARLVAALAATRPDHVAVEWDAGRQADLDARYAAYRAGHYVLSANEVDQIGLRLAAALKLPRVDAVDWTEDAPGADANYDYAGWLKARGRSGELEALAAEGKRRLGELDALNRCRPVADWLRNLNTPAYVAWDDGLNYRIATLSDAAHNPGAAWVGAWHARNLRIAANLKRVAGAPGDRTVAIFGAGHAGLLRTYGAGMGFTVADTGAALPPPARPHCPAG